MPGVLSIAGIALAELAIRRAFLRRRIGGFWSIRQQLGISLVLAGMAVLVVTAAALAAPSVIVALPLLAAIAACDIADAVSFRYFGVSVGETIRHLPVSPLGPHAFKAAMAYIHSFLPKKYPIASCGVLIAAPLIASRWLPPGPELIGSGAFAVVLGVATAVWRRRAPHDDLAVVERAIVLAPDTVDRHPLQRCERPGAFTLAAPPQSVPGTILLVILESAGARLPSSQDPKLSLADRLRQLSGAFEAWIAPVNAISNSSCTDVVLPSILTGAAPHESSAKLHRLPFLFDIAGARGYRTGFFTSSSLDWAGLGDFFAGARIDTLFTAETDDLPYVNDLGIDDHIAARRLAEWLDAGAAPAFAVLYSNALHVPYQRDSEIAIPDTLTARRDRATYIVERELALLFETLEANGRFDDALVLVVGDHGELFYDDPDPDDASPPSRLTALSETIIRPLFLIKPPSDLGTAFRDTLRRNGERLIGHIDIAPTIADLLGVNLAADLRYAGRSLLRPLDDDRVQYVLTTNEWRSWPRSAVGIFRGRSSAIVDYLDDRLCRYHGADAGAGFERDALLASGLGEPLVQRALTRIYKERLGL
ncbi:MAG: sulfatase-like hydrolase/transferase [Xanthobacteraceae bacterium]|nr:sulfatase-like hydrolase/transferase [Xanthobacteraceae bacterium]